MTGRDTSRSLGSDGCPRSSGLTCVCQPIDTGGEEKGDDRKIL